MGISTGTAILIGGLASAGASVYTANKNKPKAPPAIPAAPPAAKPATQANASVVNAGQTAKQAAGAAASSTNPTGGQGLITPPQTSGSKLLG